MGGTAERLDDFIAATRSLATEREFVARYAHPFLVREATGGEPRPITDPQDRSTLKVAMKAAAPVGDGFARDDVWLYPLRPRDARADALALTLGRDEACDVVVDDPTISLVHARFTVEPVGDEDEDGPRYFLADAGSSNGTYVDGAPVRARRVLLEDQVALRFGPHVKFTFFAAPGFFQFLDFYRRIKRKS